jgi:thiamine biosynthesis lipoprotein
MDVVRTNNDVLIHVSRPAMAGEFEICFPAGLYPDGTNFALDTLDVVESLEEQLSFFRPSSAIHEINRYAADEPVSVEPALFELLCLAMQLYEETDGAYDITSTPLWEAWGFARRAGRMPSESQLNEAMQRVGGNLVELDKDRHTIRFRKPGVQISLGSVGKGYALDQCSEKLRSLGMNDFLLSGDQSSVLAHGTAWTVGICDPSNAERQVGVIRLQDRALGTSGVQFQSFQHEGHCYGHIFDPRTGKPVEGVLSTTVLAPSAALADMLSTAFFVLGPKKAVQYCQAHPEIGLVMFTSPSGGSKGSSEGPPEMWTAGLSQETWAETTAK